MVPLEVPWVVVTVYSSGLLQNRRVSTGARSDSRLIVWQRPDWLRLDLPFRVEDDLATVFGRSLVGAAVEEAVAIAIARAEVKAAEVLLLLGVLVVVCQVVGLGVADVDAGRAGAAASHKDSATTVGILLVLLRDSHLVLASSHLRG